MRGDGGYGDNGFTGATVNEDERKAVRLVGARSAPTAVTNEDCG